MVTVAVPTGDVGMTVTRIRRQIDDPQWCLDDANKRLHGHIHDCKTCLQYVAGYKADPCQIHVQVTGQIARFQGAVERAWSGGGE